MIRFHTLGLLVLSKPSSQVDLTLALARCLFIGCVCVVCFMRHIWFILRKVVSVYDTAFDEAFMLACKRTLGDYNRDSVDRKSVV